MLQSIRLRNLRSFSNNEESPFVDLKPITVFIGKNSSGKSSCLRSLPLLRQSVEARTTGPILWYGSYVDFGAFSEAIGHNSDGNTIFFDFQLELSISRGHFSPKYAPFDFSFTELFGKNSINVQIELGVTETQNKTVAKSLKLKFDSYEYELELLNENKCNLTINKETVKGIDTLNFLTRGQFLPEIGRLRKIERTIDGLKRTHRIWEEYYLNYFFTSALKNKLSQYFHPNTSENTIIEGIDKLGICAIEDIEKDLKNVFRATSSFKKNFKNISTQDRELIHSLALHKNLPYILSLIDKELESTFKNIRYIAPLRATAERYYRHQDLQIDEIDHTGSNLAMLLKSWSSMDNSKFSEWTMDNFGFKVRVNESGLHYALMVQTKGDKREYNINDMGFGFSQILPIVASIWLETTNLARLNRRNSPKKQLIFAIEQPELHLHPEYQAKLATMFSKIVHASKSQNINLSIIFETHSKTMVDTLGDNIEDGIINKDDINIALFEKCETSNSSIVKFASYDDEGNLDNWPIGFFSGR
ncbi:AAA family ATPase [Shewanella sp. SR43-8]|uniref:AAA family ATPase n=1 Tax=Shewanella sp. SR43-8 TaxID=2760938 RepID=UPI0015FFC178|nr:AAA family ATPase [Shewanella sp. SR43-8]MBB1321515.1 AAA family ATPase [Shewanella sp. SR43-8]